MKLEIWEYYLIGINAFGFILLLNRKIEKENILFKVFVGCILIIQIIIALMLKRFHWQELTFAFGVFFKEYKLFTAYLLIINVVTFIVFGIDKYKAIVHRSRIRIATLFGFAFIGGSVGGWLAMYVFRHKTKKKYFTVGMPWIIIMHVVVVFYLMNVLQK